MNNSIMINRSIFMTISMCIRKLFILYFLVSIMQLLLKVLAIVGRRGSIFALPGEEDW